MDVRVTLILLTQHYDEAVMSLPDGFILFQDLILCGMYVRSLKINDKIMFMHSVRGVGISLKLEGLRNILI